MLGPFWDICLTPSNKSMRIIKHMFFSIFLPRGRGPKLGLGMGKGARTILVPFLGTIMEPFSILVIEKHENHLKSVFLSTFVCLVAFFFYLARDGEGRGIILGPFQEYFIYR